MKNVAKIEEYVFHLQVKYGKRKQCKAKFNVRDAPETAIAQKSKEKLDLVLTKCTNSNRPLVNPIQEMKDGLRQRR